MSMHFSYDPPTGESPRQRLQPYEDTAGIPVLSFSAQLNVDVVELSFDPRTPDNTIRYLRELAAAARALADAVELAAHGEVRS